MAPPNIGNYIHINTILTQTDLNGFVYSPTTDIPWVDVTVNGFNYPTFDESALNLQQPSGFDYDAVPGEKILLAQSLAGFDYEPLGVRLVLTTELTGFEYTVIEGQLVTNPNLTGFDYSESAVPPLDLVLDLDGLEYSVPDKKLHLVEPLGDFDYPEPGRRLNLLNGLGDFDYETTGQELSINLGDFDYMKNLISMVQTTRLPGLVLQQDTTPKMRLDNGLTLQQPPE
jgi:hypothetical protein